MEFLSIMSKGSTQEKILWSFDFFDIDRNGYIERQEMIKVWNILHPTYFPYLSYYRGPRGCIRDGGTWEQRLTIRSLHSGYTGCPKSRISVLRLFIIDFISLFFSFCLFKSQMHEAPINLQHKIEEDYICCQNHNTNQILILNWRSLCLSQRDKDLPDLVK